MKRKIFSVLMTFVMIFSLMPVFKTTAQETDVILGDELIEVLGCNAEELLEGCIPETTEPLPCVVWITDIDYETPVRNALQAAERTRENGGLENVDSLYYTVYDEKTGEKLVQVDMKLDEDPVYVQTYIETKRQEAKQLYLEQNSLFAEQWINEGVTYISGYSPCIFADITIEIIKKLLDSDLVKRIDYCEESQYEIESLFPFSSTDIVSLQSKIDATNISAVKQLYNVSGYNVKIGQLEPACPSFSGIINNNDCIGSGLDNITHADNVYTVMHTIAPNATYYASGLGSIYINTEWLLDQGVNVINMSFGANSPATFNKYTTEARWLDHVAFNHDVHVVKSAGNRGESKVTSPGMSYNAITVGNVTDNGNRYTGNSSGSGASSFNNESINLEEHKAYKPDIMAPGCYPSGDCGTSYSAPMVSATIALMGNKWPGILTKQHLVKSVLTTGTNASINCCISMDTEYREYGAGILNARSAFYAINNNNYIELGTVSSSNTYVDYYFTVSSTAAIVRVGLNYTNRIVFPSQNHLNMTDLPLYSIDDVMILIYSPSNQLVAVDGQPYINVKIVKFDPALYGTGTYRIRVQKQTNNNQNNPITRFSISWRRGDL